MKEILLKRIDEYMMNFFNGLNVIEDTGKSQDVPVIWGDSEETKDWAFRQADRYVNSNDAQSFITKARLPVVGVMRKDDNIGDVVVPKNFRHFEPSKVNVTGDGNPPKVVYEINVLSGLYEQHYQMTEQVFLKLAERSHWKITRQEETESYKNLKILIEAELKGL